MKIPSLSSTEDENKENIENSSQPVTEPLKFKKPLDERLPAGTRYIVDGVNKYVYELRMKNVLSKIFIYKLLIVVLM